MRFDPKAIALLLAGLAGASPAVASQTQQETQYEYDALGRLVRVNQIGGAVQYDARYAYDMAGNRATETVSGVTARVAVVPLGGGYRIIPLRP